MSAPQTRDEIAVQFQIYGANGTQDDMPLEFRLADLVLSWREEWLRIMREQNDAKDKVRIVQLAERNAEITRLRMKLAEAQSAEPQLRPVSEKPERGSTIAIKYSNDVWITVILNNEWTFPTNAVGWLLYSRAPRTLAQEAAELEQQLDMNEGAPFIDAAFEQSVRAFLRRAAVGEW